MGGDDDGGGAPPSPRDLLQWAVGYSCGRQMSQHCTELAGENRMLQ